MPLSSKKPSKKQLQYNRKRTNAAKHLYKRIQEDYIKLRLKQESKYLIICKLQNKYKNKDGKPYSRMTIYNALNFREINRRIRATQACDPLLVARAGQGTSKRCTTVFFLMVRLDNRSRIQS